MNRILLFLLVLVISCATVVFNLKRDSQVLSEKEAKYRKTIISDLSYRLSFDFLDQSQEYFKGDVVLNFEGKKSNKDLRLDFYQGKVTSVIINDVPLENFKYNGFHIEFNSQFINNGSNTVQIKFEGKYSTVGDGLHRFVDPLDNETYLYTNFEPYDAHLLFPSFDQPNLKATYELQVKVPSHWTVISAEKEQQVEKIENGKIWYFPQSQRFSTYIFSLHAGPYFQWSENFRYPLRLFVRKSLKKSS
jgi:aminopeptidase N